MTTLKTTVKVVNDPKKEQEKLDPSLLDLAADDPNGIKAKVKEQMAAYSAGTAPKPRQPTEVASHTKTLSTEHGGEELAQQPLGCKVSIHTQVTMRQIAPGVAIHEGVTDVSPGAAKLTVLHQPKPSVASPEPALGASKPTRKKTARKKTARKKKTIRKKAVRKKKARKNATQKKRSEKR